MTAELQAYASLKGRQNVRLASFLHDQALNIDDIYRSSGNSGWTSLRRAAGLLIGDVEDKEMYFGRRFTALLHNNDPEQIALMAKLADTPLDALECNTHAALRLQMLAYQVDGAASRVGSGRAFAQRLKGNPTSAAELAELAQVLTGNSLSHAVSVPGLEWTPLCLHGHYRLNEILSAVQFLTATKHPLFKTGVLRLNAPRYTQLFSAPISRSVRIVSAAT